MATTDDIYCSTVKHSHSISFKAVQALFFKCSPELLD